MASPRSDLVRALYDLVDFMRAQACERPTLGDEARSAVCSFLADVTADLPVADEIYLMSIEGALQATLDDLYEGHFDQAS